MFSFSPGFLTLQTSDEHHLESREQISLSEETNLNNVSMTINGKYLNEILNVLMDDSVILEFTNDETPVVVLPGRDLEQCFSKHVLVPMHESL